jgi:hypothetical protein
MPKDSHPKPARQRSLTQEIPEREHSLANSLGQDISYDADELAQGPAKADQASHPAVEQPPVDVTDEPYSDHGVIENMEDGVEEQSDRTE